ncbi:MAG: hemJ [Candidatus Midichloriaceae bacterium]|nr:hemJ [Candidatus Midichloriaceae bacterium]
MNTYLILKSLHIISFTAWMAGMFYLPRLYVYHTRAENGSQMDETFKIMELKLLRVIMNPAMILTVLFGVSLIYEIGFSNLGGWFHVKLLLVIFMMIFHAKLARIRKDFIMKSNIKDEN